ncbi:MAG: hypothetical protein H6Q64_1783, partial [Firmicutes bacterium]|nr:hypothetical protein [Bacillota bacterium]
LDINQKYFLVLIEPDEEFNIDTLYSYSKEWLTSRGWVHHTCIVWMKTLIVICPVHFKQQTLEIDSNWERHYVNIRQHKKDMEKKFNIGLSFAIGEKYSPVELHRSYTEAKTTMNINRLMGEKNFLKHFHDQGIFSLLYLHDPELLKEHCYKTLGKLIQHDREYKTELMDALRMLLDSNMNWKETAGKLFIHVNTLHYRMNKVQELLGLDLGTLHNQADLYITLKLYDSLVANGFIKE